MQRFVNEKCQDFLKEGWLVNLLDDFAIKTCGTLQDHIRNIERFLQRMGEIEVFLKDSKCQWFAKEIPFLGFMVNRYGYWKQPEKLEAIREYGTPKSQKDVRIFTGMVNFYRPFADHLSVICKPLYDLLKKNQKFMWSGEQQVAFEKVKATILDEVFLVFPDQQKVFTIDFDASEYGTGACLQQHDSEGNLRPIEFFSYKWNKAEYNYSTPDKELYGLVLALRHWYKWLFGAEQDIVVYTDHKSLRDFSKTQLLKPRHARWSLVLEDYRGRLTIRWISGKQNVIADALSRDPRFVLTARELEERRSTQVLPETVFQEEENVLLRTDQMVDISMDDDDGVVNTINDNGTPTATEEEEEETENDQVLITKISLRKCQPHQRDITDNPNLQNEVLYLCHDHGMAGHNGLRKTLDLIARKYWWEHVSTNVKKYIEECDLCQRSKPSHQAPLGKLVPLLIPQRNWQHISMDFIVKLPQSEIQGVQLPHDSILVVVDRRSKMAHFIPTQETVTAEGTA
ncbi:hypothetical protein SeMB42_g07996, partial [Synchytrium endobioticum]